MMAACAAGAADDEGSQPQTGSCGAVQRGVDTTSRIITGNEQQAGPGHPPRAALPLSLSRCIDPGLTASLFTAPGVPESGLIDAAHHGASRSPVSRY